jgi:hypothetical protein
MFDDPLSTGVTSFHYDGAIHFPYFISGRQTIARIQCGDEYTAVFLRYSLYLLYWYLRSIRKFALTKTYWCKKNALLAQRITARKKQRRDALPRLEA